jgi:hypothetical protein
MQPLPKALIIALPLRPKLSPQNIPQELRAWSSSTESPSLPLSLPLCPIQSQLASHCILSKLPICSCLASNLPMPPLSCSHQDPYQLATLPRVHSQEQGCEHPRKIGRPGKHPFWRRLETELPLHQLVPTTGSRACGPVGPASRLYDISHLSDSIGSGLQTKAKQLHLVAKVKDILPSNSAGCDPAVGG